MWWRDSSEQEREALRAANGADLLAERWTRWMRWAAVLVLVAVVLAIALR